MQFKNRPNECVTTTDGREVWLSRSVATAVCILLECEGRPYILVNQRGPGMPDFAGYWNLPCGYLDYDETTAEAAMREVWEECGVNTLELLAQATCEFFSAPWDVNSTPRGARQNVTIHHGLFARVAQLPPVSNANNEPDETTDIRWLPLSDVETLTFAFNHHERIADFLAHVEKLAGISYR
ncbi:NUDIX hydrolase [Viridibacterium curvum]|uniref:Nudix hydrolase domain-containing protein n=1 Tax=Viridibacterium curvum TaxID=1101404 RepID=A0ABP9QT29_9RHOO